MDTTDLTPAQTDAMEADEMNWTPSQEDWDWFLSETHVDPMERVDW